MAEIRRHRGVLAAALLALGALAFAPARADDQGPKNDLYDRPVLAVDPGMHTAKISSQAADAEGRFAVTGGDDRTVRVWSLAERKLSHTIWMPVGSEKVGDVYAVAISPDGSTIAAVGFIESRNAEHPIYIFDREAGDLIRRISGHLPDVTDGLTFSPDGRYLAATLGGGNGLRVFDRDQGWSEAYRDDQYRDNSYSPSFTHDGRLATASYDGWVRFYQYDPNSNTPNFRRVGAIMTPNALQARGVAFSADDKLLAIYYKGIAAVDILDANTLRLVGERRPAGAIAWTDGTYKVSWSRDSQTLFAAVSPQLGADQNLVFTWDRGGLGDEKRMAYCADHPARGLDALPGGRVLVASTEPCLGLMDGVGNTIWSAPSPILDLRWQADGLRISEDGKAVDFGYGLPGGPLMRFDVSSLTLSSPPTSEVPTFAPSREGLTIGGWRDGTIVTLNGRPLPFQVYDRARSLAVAPGAKRFFLGSAFALTAFDDSGAPKWRWQSPNEVWAVNASKDGRIVVSADGDGAIRWRRADDGRELLSLQVLPNGKELAKWDWVLWTPEGFYEATPGAEKVLKWVVNHGPDKAATTLPVSAIAKLHRPNALPHILDQLETAHALGVDDITVARLDVQKATGSAKPPGGVLRVLAVGIDSFGDKAGGLRLNYAAEDAHDVATAILESQKGGPGKASLYGDVDIRTLTNDKADGAAILDALDAMVESMEKSAGQDVAVVLLSSHGEVIDDKFYFIPYGFDLGSRGRSVTTAVPASDIGDRVAKLAAHGKVLLLLDACYSGAVGAQTWAKDPDAKLLADAMDQENVMVLTSSTKDKKSEELPEWRHGSLAQAFLDALVGASDPEGIVTVSTLEVAMENDVDKLTSGRQHLGMRHNFSGDLFVASHN